MVAAWVAAAYPASASNQTLFGIRGAWPERAVRRMYPLGSGRAAGMHPGFRAPICRPHPYSVSGEQVGMGCMRLGTGVDVCNRLLNRRVVA